ncbi:MAG: ATP-binding cassette domain-containing protein [Candidatus Thorarchaeota archaeon]|nr:ATP-binding cassette domain-containing protein [Candidatus Thorarchaeota archaeon]
MSDGKDTPILRVENLRAFYTSKSGLVRAVNDVTFEIKEGEAVGLFGESGSGKTSIALAILGIFDRMSRYYASTSGDKENQQLWALRDKVKKQGRTSEEMEVDLPGVEGRILYKGKDLVALDEKEYRKIRGNEITYVPQGTAKSLNPYSKIGPQIAEALWTHDEDAVFWEREVARLVLEALDLVELADPDIRQNMKPSEFSMGEDQRILIAMAMITNPVLMIADEPTTAVDVGVQRRVLDAIMLVRDKLKIAFLIISNDQGVIAQTCDKIAVMSAGRIMEFGDVKTVLVSPGHPFTRALIMSNPSMEVIRKIREKGLRIRGIPGKPPDMTNLPPGCPFNSRCDYAQDICREQIPEYREVEPGHWIFCHRYEELPKF